MNTKYISDKDLVRRIRDRIKWDIRVNNYDIAVNSYEGRVVLSGTFDKAYRHEAAVEIILSTHGINGFEDLSNVMPDFLRSDEELRRLVKKQIDSFELLPGEWIHVAVAEGVVKLEGVVFRPRLKAFAASDSWGLSGVQDCINLIEVKQPPSTKQEHNWLQFHFPTRFPIQNMLGVQKQKASVSFYPPTHDRYRDIDRNTANKKTEIPEKTAIARQLWRGK